MIELFLNCSIVLLNHTFARNSGADLCWALGGIICNFTPILPYFRNWGGWTSTTILFRCANQVKTKKRDLYQNWNTFFPKFRWRPKKKFSPKMKYFFFPNSSGHLRSDAHQSQIMGWDADVDHTKTIGGDTVKLLGDISPPPMGFGHLG